MVGYEMSLIRSSLGLALPTYSGLGWMLPEVFFASSTLCGLHVDVIAKGLLKTRRTVCGLQSRALLQSINSANPSSMISSAPAHPTIISATTLSPVSLVTSTSPSPTEPSQPLALPSQAYPTTLAPPATEPLLSRRPAKSYQWVS
jgi:hypothetical protein